MHCLQFTVISVTKYLHYKILEIHTTTTTTTTTTTWSLKSEALGFVEETFYMPDTLPVTQLMDKQTDRQTTTDALITILRHRSCTNKIFNKLPVCNST